MAPPPPPPPSAHSSSSAKGYVAMVLLAVQFGLQPILYKEFAARATHSSVLVIACEACKFALASLVLAASGELRGVLKAWRWQQSLAASGLPACTYAVQNVLVQISYQNLPPIVFNLVNQTKLLWTALFVFLLMGKRFSRQQCLAMLILLSAAVLLSLAKDSSGGSSGSTTSASSSFELGLLPVLIASILSGFGAATTQRSMQQQHRNTALVTMELSVYGSVFLFGSLLWSPASSPSALSASTSIAGISSLGDWRALFDGWDALTLVPVVANALGGLLVGAVTKYVGGVLKSFALVCGIACTAFAESYLYGSVLPVEVYAAAALVTTSLFLYNAFPYQEDAGLKTKPKTS